MSRNVCYSYGCVPVRLSLIQTEEIVAGKDQHQLLQPVTQLLREVQQLHALNMQTQQMFRVSLHKEHKCPHSATDTVCPPVCSNNWINCHNLFPVVVWEELNQNKQIQTYVSHLDNISLLPKSTGQSKYCTTPVIITKQYKSRLSVRLHTLVRKCLLIDWVNQPFKKLLPLCRHQRAEG